MSTRSALDYLEENIFSEIDDLEFEPRKSLKPGDFEEYEVDTENQLLTEEAEELRSYGIEFKDFSFGLSAETGLYQGNYSMGISAEIQGEVFQGLMNQIAETYEDDLRNLGPGEYILDISDW